MKPDRKARILAEIRQYSNIPLPLEPDDITPEDIGREYKVGKRQAQNILLKLAIQNPDKFRRILVRLPGASHPAYILRSLK